METLTLTLTNSLNLSPNSKNSRVSLRLRISNRKGSQRLKNGNFDDTQLAKVHSEMKALSFQPNCASLSATMLCYAQNENFSNAQALWSEIISSSYKPDIKIVSALIDVYTKFGEFDEIVRIVHESVSRHFG